MATAKMAISSGDSTSILYTTTKVAGKIYHTLTFLDRISDETLDAVVSLCAGRSALVRIQREQSSKLIKRLAATQIHTPILDDETWAAKVGGNIVGEVEGHCSHLTPWKEANFGIKFLYRRAADEIVSSQESEYPIYPHDGTLYSWLLKSKTSAPYQTISPVRDSNPSSSKLPRTTLSTPPSNYTSKQVSYLPTAVDSLPRPSPLILITPMTPPTSPTARESTRACDEIPDMPNSRQQQILTKKPKPLPPSAALLSQLFFKEQDNVLSCRKRADCNQANSKKDAKQSSDVHSRQDTGDDTESCMGSFEVAAIRRQQNRRLQRKDLAPPADFEENATDRKPNRLQARPVQGRWSHPRTRVQFREREPTRRRAIARAMENTPV